MNLSFYFGGHFVINDKELFQKGLRDGIAIGLSYIPAAMAISIAATRQNFPFGIWELMSALLYSSSAQAAILNLLSNGATAFLIYILTFSIMNFRHVLFSLSLSQKLDSKIGVFGRVLFAPFNTDEIYSIVVQQPGKIKSSYLLGISIIPYLGQIAGITAGFLFTQSLTSLLQLYITSFLLQLTKLSIITNKKLKHLPIINNYYLTKPFTLNNSTLFFPLVLTNNLLSKEPLRVLRLTKTCTSPFLLGLTACLVHSALVHPQVAFTS